MTRLEEIRKRLEKATKGPWYADAAISGDGSVVMSEDTGFRVAHLPETRSVINCDHDAEFMAHARVDIPYLLSIVDAARAHFEAVRGTMAAQGPTGKRLGEMLEEVTNE